MRKRRGAKIAGVAAALSLLGATSASAATEIGNPCVANDTEVGWTVVGLFRGDITLEPQPRQSGVITRWRVQVAPSVGSLAQQLGVFRPTNEEAFRKVAESATETVVEGSNEFATRIPVEQYDHLGLHGPIATFFCDKQDLTKSGVFKGDVPLGSTQKFTVESGTGTPVTAIVEPDRDGDGYGDESQDRCPKSADFQADCPRVALRVSATARRRTILLRVRADNEAEVMVYGQVGWGIKPKPRPKIPNPRQKTRIIVGLSGGTKNVGPGKTTRFTIRLPKPVMRRLGRLTPQESLKAKITLRATNLAGLSKNTRLTVKLKGQEGT